MPKLEINSVKYQLPKEQYFDFNQTKKKIVLHFTAGSTVEGAYQSWVQSAVQVATAFIVDKDGTVYQLFDPSKWAYHLGITAGDPYHTQDKQSIGIEIVNEGPLKKKGDFLYWWPKDYGTMYNGLVFNSNYRGFSHYAAFPSVQVAAVGELCKRLGDLYNIPMEVIGNVDDYLWKGGDSYLQDFKGIVTHQNYRTDKVDIGPAWPWEEFKSHVARL